MKIHHIGFVVADRARYRANLPVQEVVAALYDPVQKAHLELIDAGGAYIELIEPAEAESFTWNFLQKGGGYHHICYEVDSEAAAREAVTAARMVVTLGPVEAPLLNGQVLFARNRNREMVEFVWHG